MEAPEQKLVCGNVVVYPCLDRGKRCYTLVWYVGKERIRQTYRDWEKAKARISEIGMFFDEGGADITKVSPRDLRYYKLCENQLGGVPLDVAVKFYINQHQLKPAGKTVAEVVAEFLSNYEKEKHISQRQKETLRHHLKTFANEITAPIASVNSRAIDAHLRKDGWSARTRANHRQSISSLYHYARRKGYVSRAVQTEADLSEKIRVPASTPNLWTPDEFAALLRNSGEARPLVALGGLAGLRTAESLRITWAALKPNGIYLEREITKTKSSRVAPCGDALRAWLDLQSCTGVHNDDKILESYGLSRPYAAIKRMCKRAGLVWRPNALRHSFASYYLALTNDAAKTALATGHSVQVLLNTYKMISVSGQPITKQMAEDWFNTMP